MSAPKGEESQPEADSCGKGRGLSAKCGVRIEKKNNSHFFFYYLEILSVQNKFNFWIQYTRQN